MNCPETKSHRSNARHQTPLTTMLSSKCEGPILFYPKLPIARSIMYTYRFCTQALGYPFGVLAPEPPPSSSSSSLCLGIFKPGLPLLADGLKGLPFPVGVPNPELLLLECRRESGPPSCASRSRKSLHSSASPSLLAGLLMPISGVAGTDELPIAAGKALFSGLSAAVDDARRNGLLRGNLRLVWVDAPGLARPADSFCSGTQSASLELPKSSSAEVLNYPELTLGPA